MTPKIEKIWLEDNSPYDLPAIRVDFDNNGHYRVEIAYPITQHEIAQALVDLASLIGRDPHLTPNLK